MPTKLIGPQNVCEGQNASRCQYNSEQP